jgi:sarcosine oxidase subunit alpha
MSPPFRLASGGRIDRARPISFNFDGKTYQGFAGDTLASALLANGVHLIGRSYKYHRPRGIFGAGADEPNALVGLEEGAGRFTPNLRATQIPLSDGLVATSQNRWPSLEFDAGEINDWFAPLFSAGFYYKTFMGPNLFGKNWAWKHVYEPFVRQMAGLGEAPSEPDPDAYAQYFEHCDVLVVGAGPAGLAAAKILAASGADVIVCDEQAELGGSLLAETQATIDGVSAADWLKSTIDELTAAKNVRLMTRTQAFGYYAQNFVVLGEIVSDAERKANADAPRERMWQVRAKQVVLACGAIERPLVFSDNDRPGVMLADAARTYLNRYGVKVGERVVVAAAHDSAYRAALDLAAAGVKIQRLVDLRSEALGPWPAAARGAGLEIMTGVKLVGTRGKKRVSAVGVASKAGVEWIACDALLMSGGWTPSVHLHSQSRGKLMFDDSRQIYVPGEAVQAERSAGACKGTFALADVINEGAAAGVEAARAAGSAAPAAQAYQIDNALPAFGGVLGDQSARGVRHARAFVDFQNDVCAEDIQLAVREGFHSIEHVKRYTAVGMATDQGKTSNMNALAIAAEAVGAPLATMGHTTFRQPYTPVTFGAFAGASRGELFDPVRRTPIHGWAEEQGAAFEDVGLWKRAWYFPKAGEDVHAAVERECKATRERVGLFDGSTLGKIEVVGPDAATFLERLYTNALMKLEVGRCRYGLMLNEQGFIMDDGVIARLAPDRFHVTTTTGGAPRVMHQMEDYLQTEFTDLKVWLTSTTEQWAVIAVQGPRARDLIASFIEGVDISREKMPHMSVREGRICGLPARLMRVSFTGELGFEINVAPDFSRAVWEALWEAGRAYDAVAYGTESMHVMRAEKGYLIVGQDTDGTVTPADAGHEWAIGKAKKDFVGKRSLIRPDMLAPNRKQVVGLLTEDPMIVLEEGAQIVAAADASKGAHAIGHVTSSYMSPTLNRSIALALVEDGRARKAKLVFGLDAKGAVAATVSDTVFYDKKGTRLDV